MMAGDFTGMMSTIKGVSTGHIADKLGGCVIASKFSRFLAARTGNGPDDWSL